MKRRQHALSSSKPLAVSMDAQTIDALYGLEPVFEPGAMDESGEPIQFLALSCPYCGESYTTCVDFTSGPCCYVEDCQVCCQPMELTIELDDADKLLSFVARRLD